MAAPGLRATPLALDIPMNVGLLTGGGDCPGLNAVIRAVVMRITKAGGSCLGIHEGWRGLVRNLGSPLAVDSLTPEGRLPNEHEASRWV